MMHLDRQKAEQTFLEYASRYDMSDPKIRLKAEHTLRVASLCGTIAGSLDMTQTETELAWLCGLLHDIGRFEQVRIYHTFRDGESVNHAQLSADLLFDTRETAAKLLLQGHGAKDIRIPAADTAGDLMIREYIEDPSFDRIIELAIRCHNMYRLPADLSVKELTFCRILRDADKIDILRVNRETPMTEIYNLPEEAFLTSEISDPVFEDLMAHRDVNRANSRTGIDFLMGHIAFVFGLVFPVSFRLVREQGYLADMLAFESQNENTRERMKIIRSEIMQYLQMK